MSQEFEIEAKYLISRDSMDKIMRYFHRNADDFTTQINHYLDTDNLDLLHLHHTVLRIRDKNKSAQITLKMPHDEHLLEINYPLDTYDLQNISLANFPDILEFLHHHSINPANIKHQGSLTTYRCQISYQFGELFLDISYFDDVVDYEVEFEVTTTIEEAKSSLLSLFALLKIIDYQPSLSKAKRFLEKKAS